MDIKMKKKIKKFILKTFFKRELENLFWAFQNVANQIDKSHLHKPNRKSVDKAISNWRKVFISIQE